LLIINKTHRNFIGSGTVWCLEFVKIPFFVGDNDEDLSSTVGGVLDVEILKDEEELAISVKAFRVGLKSFMTFLFIIKNIPILYVVRWRAKSLQLRPGNV